MEGPLAVDDWDRAMGYDTASWFASAGASTWLSGGGRAARAVGFGVLAWDTAGNAVGLGRGALDVYDEGGFTWQNSLQIGGSLLGLGGNLAAFSRMGKGIPDAEDTIPNRFPSVGAARPQGRILQRGGHTIKPSTARALNEATGRNLHRREWGRALERLKDEFDLPNDHHGLIDEFANYWDDAGNLFDNLENYLQ